MKKKILSALIAISAVLLFFVVKPQTASAATTDSNNDPVFFIPGAFDNNDSWQKMVSILDPNSVHPLTKLNANAATNKVLRQDVRKGQAGQRPFVIVLFPVNQYHEDVIRKDGDALRDALNTYNQKTPFTNGDFVAQSNGGTITTTYLEKNPSAYHFDHFISIGTPYNFQAGNGAANTAFLNRLIQKNNNLPDDLDVTNVIGASGDDDSTDGVVSRDSALSGRLIFEGNVGSFKQMFITGEDASHGNQESSPQFASIVSDILGL